jgi:hypothetical protein
MQAADLLDIEEHVCMALAGRIFNARATWLTKGSREFAKQVFFHAIVSLYKSVACAFTVMSNFSHPLRSKLSLQFFAIRYLFAVVVTSCLLRDV